MTPPQIIGQFALFGPSQALPSSGSAHRPQTCKLPSSASSVVDRLLWLAVIEGWTHVWICVLLGPTFCISDTYMVQNIFWNVAVNSRYLASGQKAISFTQKQPNYMVDKTYYLAQYLDLLPSASVTRIGFKRCSIIPKLWSECGRLLTLSSIW